MADAKRDENGVTTLLGVSEADGQTLVRVTADPTTHVLTVDDGNYGFVPNSNFTDQPAFTAPTDTNGRFIDGTAGGSLTNNTYGWGYGTSGASVSSANFDTVAARTSMKITATALDKTGGSVDLVMAANVPAYSGPTLPLATLAYAARVIAGNIYTFSMDYYILSLSNVAEVSSNLRVTWYDSAGTRISQTVTNAIDNTILTTWTSLPAQDLTAPANATYVTFGPSIQASGADGAGRAMTAYYTNIQVTSTGIANPQRALRDGNFITSIMGASSVDGVTPVVVFATPDGALLIDSN